MSTRGSLGLLTFPLGHEVGEVIIRQLSTHALDIHPDLATEY
jgi:hypothetical protein